MLYPVKDKDFVAQNFESIINTIFKDYPNIIKIFTQKSGNDFLLKFLEKLNQVIIELAPLTQDKEEWIVENIQKEYNIGKKIIEKNEKIKQQKNSAQNQDQEEADNILQNI